MKKRQARLGEQFKREISQIFRTRMRDPRIGMPTVTRVDVTPDLWLARVKVRVTGDEEERAQAMDGLEAASSFIRHELGQTLHIRRIPEIRFEEDRAIEHATRIESLLQGMDIPEASDESEEEPGTSSGPGAPGTPSPRADPETAG